MSSAALNRHHAHLSGQGRPLVVFSHGFGCDRHIWRDVAPAFEATHRVLVFNHAGCGESLAAWDEHRHASLQGYVDDLLDIIDEADAGPVVAVGHSVGSVIALLASLAQPQRFAKLVLLAPSPRFLDDPPDYVGGFGAADLDGLFQLMESNHYGWAHLLAPLAMGEDNPVALTRQFEDALCALEPRIARHFARLAFHVDIRDQLPRVTVPSTIVQCTHDSIAPRAVGHWMHRHMPGSTLHELVASGHCPHVSHAAATIGLIRGALDG